MGQRIIKLMFLLLNKAESSPREFMLIMFHFFFFFFFSLSTLKSKREKRSVHFREENENITKCALLCLSELAMLKTSVFGLSENEGQEKKRKGKVKRKENYMKIIFF